MVPESIRTELLRATVPSNLRTNHTRGIWSLSWLSTLGGANYELLGWCFPKRVVCGVEGSTSRSVRVLVCLSPVVAQLMVSIVHGKMSC